MENWCLGIKCWFGTLQMIAWINMQTCIGRACVCVSLCLWFKLGLNCLFNILNQSSISSATNLARWCYIEDYRFLIGVYFDIMSFYIEAFFVSNFLPIRRIHRVIHAWCTAACTGVLYVKSTGRWGTTYRITQPQQWPLFPHHRFKRWTPARRRMLKLRLQSLLVIQTPIWSWPCNLCSIPFRYKSSP